MYQRRVYHGAGTVLQLHCVGTGRPPRTTKRPPFAPASAAARLAQTEPRAQQAPGAAPARQQQAQLLALTQWALSAGAKFVPGLRPAPLAGGGRGMVTTNPISAGQALVSVPAALVLGSDAPPPAGGAPPGLWASLPWDARLAALLLAERAAGPAARLAPFVAALPPFGDAALPACWPAGDVEQLQCSAVRQQAR
jgi:hypothetical protein